MNPQLRKTVLVTGGENRSSLAVTRSLGEYGCRVIVSGNARKTLASKSKFCAKGYKATLDDGDLRFISDIIAIVEQENVDIVYPITEPECIALAKYRDSIPYATIVAIPEYKKIINIYNKFKLIKRAEMLGVSIPATVFITGKEDYWNKRHLITSFPAVVKPYMSKIPVHDGYLNTGVVYADNLQKLDRLYSTSEVLQFPSLIQEKIEGNGTGLFTLFDGKNHLALFSHVRRREKPPSGGVSVVSESVPVDEEMAVAAEKLLSDVGWQGVAMVEFKRDNRDGQAKLMEINGRFWGTLQLAIFSGVNFPVLLHEFLLGKKQKHPGKYKVGLRMKWFLGTFDHLLIRLRNADSDFKLTFDDLTKYQAIVDFLKIKEKNMVFDVIRNDDILPFFHEIKLYIWSLCSKK